MIETLAVFLPLVFVLIVLCAVILDRGICAQVAGGSVGGQVDDLVGCIQWWY